jgi:hypothetical protein
MKNVFFGILLLFFPLNSNSVKSNISKSEKVSKIVVYQINSEWNERNSIKNLDDLRGCKYVYGYLEDQPDVFKQKIKSVPAVFITNNGKIIYKYQPGVSLIPTIKKSQIQEIVNKHR